MRVHIYSLEGNEDGNLVRLIAEMGMNEWELIGPGAVEEPISGAGIMEFQ